MDWDLPRPSQDGRVYWDAGPNDLLAQLQKTCIRGTPAETRYKRSTLSAGFPSPTRPGAQSPADASSDSLFFSAGSTSTSSTSTAGARFSKRRKAGQSSLQKPVRADSAGPSSSPPPQGLSAAALQRIGEISALLGAQHQQQRLDEAANKSTHRSSRSASVGVSRPLADKRANTAAATAGPSDARLGSSRLPDDVFLKAGARLAPMDSNTSLRQGAQLKPRGAASFGRSKSAQEGVLPAHISRQPPPHNARSSPARPARPTSYPLDSAAAAAATADAGDTSIQDDSLDLAIQDLPEADWEAIITTASQQASAKPLSQAGLAKPPSQPKREPASRRLVNEPIIAGMKTSSPAPGRPRGNASSMMSSQQNVRAPYKPPTKVHPPAQPVVSKTAARLTAAAAAKATTASRPQPAAPVKMVRSGSSSSTTVKVASGTPSAGDCSLRPEEQDALCDGVEFDDADVSF